jgi:hypothetical protein
VWDLINLDTTQTLVAKPLLLQLPQIAAYKLAVDVILLDWTRRGTPLAARAASTIPVQKQDLSAAGLQAYNNDIELYKLMLEEYKIHKRAYEKEQKNLDTITSLI